MNDDCRKSECRNSLPKAQKQTSIIALGIAFSRIKFTIFFILFPAIISYFRFVFFLRISCHSNVWEKFGFYFTDFRVTIACIPVTHTAQILANFVVFGRLLGKKALAKERYITLLNSVYFINSTQDLQNIRYPKICMKCYRMGPFSYYVRTQGGRGGSSKCEQKRTGGRDGFLLSRTFAKKIFFID